MTATARPVPAWTDLDKIPRPLTQSIVLEEAHVPGFLRSASFFSGLVLSLFLLWAAVAPIQEVATASGQVIPSGYIQDIQHLEGGIVREILVEDGMLVEKGQPLLRLDNTNANADLGQMLARQTSLRLDAERLRSFANNTSGRALTNEQSAILASMEDSRTSQRNVLRDQITQKEKELEGITASRAALARNVVLMEKEHAINQRLAERGSGSQIMAMTSERELNAMRGQLKEADSQSKQAKGAINEARNRLHSLDADLRKDAMKNLGEVEAELAEIDKSLLKLQSASNRAILTAPVRGLVKGLSVHTLGAVVEPGKVLLEIVPVEEDLMVEALVSPADIANLNPGQPVKVKVSAYDFSRYGSVPGTLAKVSASTFQTEDGQAYYKAKIKLDHNYAGKDADRNLLLPGMTVQADIVTGERTVMQYLLKPIHLATQDSFHER